QRHDHDERQDAGARDEPRYPLHDGVEDVPPQLTCAPTPPSRKGAANPVVLPTCAVRYTLSAGSKPRRGAAHGRSDPQEPGEDHRQRKEDPPKSSSPRAHTRQPKRDFAGPPSDAEEPEEDPGESE